MEWLTPVVRFAAAPLMPVMQALTLSLASAAHRNPTSEDCIAAAFALSAGLIGLLCICSAVCSRSCLHAFKKRAGAEIAALRSALLFREALLGEAGEGVVVL